ncbi:MAG: hemagglutinin repeat-containing protein [Aquabacterium sp.]|uniref:hemagglutinin repeat-containing protein n=1 Tax=Aquabacterium sp. TaxID=1872578 RepID=UPI003BAF4756
MQASTTLTANATSLINQGQVSGQTTVVSANTVTNTGLIDGQTTTLQAIMLDNLGAGRIYGDQLSIAAATLTQTALDGAAPVIAARQRLDIGAATIQNNEQALIYSLGDLYIGGSLDGNQHAQGQATLVNNRSATIEAAGNATINANQINNSNTRFATDTTQTTQAITEYQGSGSPNRYTPGSPGVYTYEAGGSTRLATPEGNFESWLAYSYNRTVTQSVVTDSAPASIIAGGNMLINAGTLVNDNSRVLAGGTLSATVTTLNNIAFSGTQTTADAGSVTSYWREKYCSHRLLGACIDHDYRTGSSATGYNPAPAVQTLALSPLVYSGNTSPSTLPGASSTPQIPTSKLLITTPASSTAPLIEIDPKFASLQQWLSSDYMLSQLSIDPSTVQKRLGDGFYEQSLVQDQIAQLTGRRFLDGYSSNDAEYRALLDNGVTVARAMNLRPGIALTAAQVAQLTSDIVWLESKTVTLANGQTVQVLKPQVYLVPRPGDLQANGNLMAANNLNLQVAGDAITSGGIGARQVLTMSAANIQNNGGSLNGQTVNLNATQDITSTGGQFAATDQLQLQAGRDVALKTTTASNSNAQGSTTYTDRVTSLYVSGATAQLLVNAARDLTMQAAQVTNDGAGGQTTLTAGRNLTLGTVQTADSHDIVWNAKNQRHDATTKEVGSNVAASGNLTLQASQDLTIRGSVLQSDLGQLQATAAGNVNIEAAQTHQTVDETHQTKVKGFLSSTTITTRDTADNTLNQGSALSGNSVTVQAGQNLKAQGGNIVSTQGNTALQAGQDVQILSAQDTQNQSHSRSERKSGLSIGLQSGVGVGRSSTDQSQQTLTTTQVGSNVSGQNVNITAQRDATVQASTVLADQDITVQAGRNLDITAADNTQQTTSTYSSRSTKVGLIGGVSPNQTLYGRQSSQQNGQGAQVSQSTSVLSANGGNLTLTAGADNQYRGTAQGNVTTQGADLLAGQAIRAQGNAVTLDTAVIASDKGSTFAKQSSTTLGAQLSGTAGSRITSAWTMAQNSSQTDNERLKKAERLKAAYDAYKATQGLDQLVSAGGKQNSTDTSTGSAFGVSVNLGSSSSQQQTNYDSTQLRGTNAQAKSIEVKSRDADITAVGAKLQATDISLDAAGNLNLMAAQNTAGQQSSNKGHSAGVGVTVGFGQQNGISFQLGVGGNRGTGNGSETTYDNTLVTATHQLNIKSGADTTLQGAQVAGDTVKADVGGKLNVVTLQDSSQSQSKQSSYGVNISLCIPPICYGNVVTGSVNVAQSGFSHNYQSAVGQSGIAAGQGGFDIKVQGDTSLTGAAITSTADQSKNSLQTASLSYQDLRNRQDTDSYSRSIGLAYNGGSTGSTLAANGASNLLGNIAGQQGLPDKGHDSSSTLSVISPATITITSTGNAQKDQASQQAATDLTSRDAKTANGALVNTLTLQQAANVQKDIQHAQENAQAGQIVGSVAFNVAGDIAQHYQWDEGSPQKIALHGLAGLIQASAGGQNGVAGALAAMGNEALTKQINDYINKSVPITDDMTPAKVSQAQQSRKELAEASASLLGASTVALAGGLSGKGSAQDIQVGGLVALTADKFNRQLHPKEIDWIKQNAKRFAQQQGISQDAAEQRLAQQAFREVQFGASGNTDPAAQQFLKSNTQGLLLPGDPAIPGQTVGYMFRVDPIQKANPMMYATQVVSDPAALAFYAKNGITQPTAQQIQQAAAKDAGTRSTLRNATMGAAGAAIAITVPPVISWCLSNPVACNRFAIAGGEIAAGDAIGPTGMGVAGLAAVKAVRTAGEVNAAMTAKGWSPAWSTATSVINGDLSIGTKVNMIVDAPTAKLIERAIAQGSEDFSQVRLGGWATFDDVSSTAIDLRQRAAVTGEFKPSTDGPFYVVELEVQKPLASNIGFAGSQINKEKLSDGTIANLGTLLRGGATQAEFLIPASERIQYLKPVSSPKLLGH